MEAQRFRLGALYQGPDHHYYTPVLQVEDTWILGEVVPRGTAWRLHTVVRPNGTRTRRCLLITLHAHGYRVVGVDLRSTPHLLYLDELAHTHFAITTDQFAGLREVAQGASIEQEEAAE